MFLNEFISEFGDILKDKIANAFTPIYDPQIENNSQKTKLQSLLRKPFPKQADVVLAIVEGFKSGLNGEFLVSEMGTGKTMMGICASYLLCNPKSRTLIMCPGHLVEKWTREIQITIPHAIVVNMNRPGLSELYRLREKPQGREFWVIGKERAKNHYTRSSGAFFLKHLNRPMCPDCGHILIKEPNVKKSRPFCPECESPLWQADKKKFRRFAKSEFVKRYFKKGVFDFFLADEVHQFKAGDSAQGQAYANFVNRSKYTLNLTGTLMGGYATNLFYLLFRLIPATMKEICGYNNPIKFAEKFGVIERVMKEPVNTAGNASISRSNTSVSIYEKPGISPLIFTELLLERCVFLRLDDLDVAMPQYTEHVIEVDMTQEQEEAYKKFESDLTHEVRQALVRGDRSLLGAMVNSLMAYPDGARKGESVYHPYKIEPSTGEKALVAYGPPVEEYILPKEQALIDLLLEEKKKNRKVMVCLEHTGTRDLIPDLVERFEKFGLSPLVLRQNTVKTDRRESWLKAKLKIEEVDVFITNPRLVETGLDLLEFPTIVFFQTGYSTFTLRQTSRRSWRIGQMEDVHVYYLSYNNTMQAMALSLMAEKMQVALAVEGELSDAGLTALAEGDTSMMVQMAKRLIGEEDQVSKSAGEIFTALDNAFKKSREKLDETVKEKFQKIKRGVLNYLSDKKMAIARIDERITFHFKDGDILYENRKIGAYEKDGSGIINGKLIQISPESKNNFILYEIREAS